MEKSKEIVRSKERSTAYPSVSLEEAILATTELADKLGPGPFDRETAAQALGYKGVSGASASKIAALTHFGLLERQGNTYIQSILARRIIAPKSDQDKTTAIVEALRAPKLYSKLLDRYSGQALPTMLHNILFHDFRIILSASKEATEVFKRSAEFAGLLKNGVLSDANTGATKEIPEHIDRPSETLAADYSKPSQSQDLVSVRLPSGIVVTFPQDLSYSFGLGTFAKPLKEIEETAKQIQHHEAQ
jgi:hypothetical protein